MDDIPARYACIYWSKGGDVEVHRALSGNTAEHLHKSGGACWDFWQTASTEELYFRLLQQICTLMTCEGIDPAKVHDAFKVIPEYRLTLPKGHPDSLPDEDIDLAEGPLPSFNSGGYPF